MKNSAIRTVIAFLAATLLVVGLAITTSSNLFLSNTVALWILAWIYLFVFINFVVLKFNIYQIKKMKIGGIRVGVIALIISAILLEFLPWKYGAALTNNHVERLRYTMHKVSISVEEQNSASAGKEVWISAIRKNLEDYNIYEIALDNQEWIFCESAIFTDGNNASELIIDLGEGNLFDVKFRKTPMSGVVKISSGQYEYSIDLYSAEEEEVYLDWTSLYGKITSANQYMRILYYVLYLAIVWSLVASGVILALSKYKKNSEFVDVNRKEKVERK